MSIALWHHFHLWRIVLQGCIKWNKLAGLIISSDYSLLINPGLGWRFSCFGTCGITLTEGYILFIE